MFHTDKSLKIYKTSSPHSQNELMHLSEEIVDGDGNCGFAVMAEENQTAIEARHAIADTLLTLDVERRKLFNEEIFGFFMEECTQYEKYRKLSSQVKSVGGENAKSIIRLIERYQRFTKRLDEKRRNAMKLLDKDANFANLLINQVGLYEQLSKGENDDKLIECLNGSANKRLHSRAIKMSENKNKIQECYQQIINFIENDELHIFENYIDQFRQTLWLSCTAAKEYAIEKEWSFYLWRKGKKDGVEVLEFMDNYSHHQAHPGKEVYAVFINAVHFNRLNKEFSTLILEREDSKEKPENSDSFEPASSPSSNSMEEDEDGFTMIDISVDENQRATFFRERDPNYERYQAKLNKSFPTLKNGRPDYDRILKIQKSCNLSPKDVKKDIQPTTRYDRNFPLEQINIKVRYTTQPQSLSLPDMLIDAIKIGDDRYTNFCMLLIDNYQKWKADYVKKNIEQLKEAYNKEIITHLMLWILEDARAEVFSRIYLFIKNNKKNFTDVDDYIVKLKDEIIGVNGEKACGIELFNERVIKGLPNRLGEIQQRSFDETENSNDKNLALYLKQVAAYERELRQDFLNEMILFWPSDIRGFETLCIVPSAISNKQLDKILSYCERKKDEHKRNAYVNHTTYGKFTTDYEGDTVRYSEGHIKAAYCAYKNTLAHKIGSTRETSIPNRLARIPDALEKLLALLKEGYVPLSFVEASTGNNIALLAKKYGNHQLYQYIRFECDPHLTRDDLDQPNKRGLSLTDYLKYETQNEFAIEAREKIYSFEPKHDKFVALEKAVRCYQVGWIKRNETLAIQEQSSNIASKVILALEKALLLNQSFEQRELQVIRILGLIEECRYDKTKKHYFTQQLNEVFQNIQDGPLRNIRPGKLKKEIKRSLTFFGGINPVGLPTLGRATKSASTNTAPSASANNLDRISELEAKLEALSKELIEAKANEQNPSAAQDPKEEKPSTASLNP